MLREIYRTIIATKIMTDIFFFTQKIPQLIGVCILKLYVTFKKMIIVYLKDKEIKILSLNYYVIKNF